MPQFVVAPVKTATPPRSMSAGVSNARGKNRHSIDAFGSLLPLSIIYSLLALYTIPGKCLIYIVRESHAYSLHAHLEDNGSLAFRLFDQSLVVLISSYGTLPSISKVKALPSCIFGLFNESGRTYRTRGCKLPNLIGELLAAVRSLVALAESMHYPRKKRIRDGQRQLHNLKARVDKLSQRLCILEMMSEAVGIDLRGRGPFQLPLLTELKSVLEEVETQLLAVVQSEAGQVIYARIPYLVAAQVVNDDLSVPLQNEMIHSSASIDFVKSATAFRLPFVSHYQGHFYSGSGIRVLVFVTQEGQSLLFPVSTKIYRQLIVEFEAAIVPDNQGGDLILGERLPYPVRSRW